VGRIFGNMGIGVVGVVEFRKTSVGENKFFDEGGVYTGSGGGQGGPQAGGNGYS